MKLLLLDGHSLAYRAFYALPTDLATSSGTVTNAVYGFTAMLVKVIGDEHPDHVAVAFDTPAPTFRNEMDVEYKANRKETPDLFRTQLPLIHQVLETLGIPIVELEGVEADDVIGTLATRAADAGIDTIIVTGDRDSYQLVRDPHLRVLYNKRGVSDYALYDEAGIAQRTGVTPVQYTDYAAMRGDTSDNLPGVPGIGEKTAAKLIAAYEDLEGIYEHVDDLPPKQRLNLIESRDRVFKNREMMRLRLDCDVDLDPATLERAPFDREAVRALFDQLEFRTLYPRLIEALGVDATADDEVVGAIVDVSVEHIRTPEAARQCFEARRAGATRYSLEPRWDGVPGRSALTGLGVASADDVIVYIDGDVLADSSVDDSLGRLLGADGPPLVVHRAKELAHGLAPDRLDSLDLDTTLMAYLLEPGEGKYVLDDLVGRHLGLEVRSPDIAEGTLDLDGEAAIEETGRRAHAVLALAEFLEEALAARDLLELYERIERPLVSVLADMEIAGIAIDREFLEAMRVDLAQQCDALVAKIHAAADEEFNVNSTPQLRRVLFDKLGLTPVKRTKTGPSTDADSLQKLAGEHSIVADLLRYREVQKLRSTYADALVPLIGPDGRIHATFNQIATTTGRISSESPNLQNIPVRTAEGREVRRAFVAAEGCGLMTVDYSQIELRVLAHMANDPGLIDAFGRGADVHTITAAGVFDVDEGDVDEFQRRFAKVVNYGLAYGMEAYGLGQRLDIPTDQAREILDSYFESFPAVAEFMETTIALARDRGYTTTLFGRRRPIAELASDNFRVRQMGERMAQNAPVQGSAADIFKLAMIDVDAALTQAELASRMILSVHDELIFEVPLGERDELEALVRSAMESVTELTVPLTVDVGFGPNWAEAK